MGVEIPPLLLPRDGRFGCGPSKIPNAALHALVDSAPYLMGTSHRQQPVRDLVHRVRAGVSTLYAVPAGHEVVLGNGGSTLFWDLAVFSLIDRSSAHGCFGEFSAKFASAAQRAPHLERVNRFEAPAGEVALPKRTPGADAYAWAHNETSTGAMAPIERIGAEDEALVIIDATSAAGALPVDLDAVDVYYFAPQKAFASDAGLWVAICSPRALARMHTIAAGGRWMPDSLNLRLAYENSVLDQTLNTPAIATLFLMAEQLSWLLENGGLDFAGHRIQASSGKLYGWAERHELARPFVAAPWRSPVVGTIDFAPSVDAERLCAALRANGIVDVEPYRKLGRNQIRVGMFPAVDPEDVDALTHAIDWLLPRL